MLVAAKKNSVLLENDCYHWLCERFQSRVKGPCRRPPTKSSLSVREAVQVAETCDSFPVQPRPSWRTGTGTSKRPSSIAESIMSASNNDPTPTTSDSVSSDFHPVKEHLQKNEEPASRCPLAPPTEPIKRCVRF